MIKRYQNSNKKRQTRTRFKILSKSGNPRLAVRKSNKYIEVILIDDKAQKTIYSIKGKDPIKLGTEIAQKALKLKISKVSFDRGGYQYHGQIKAVADAARAVGLIF